MNIGDLIYSIITLILMVLIILSPILRKIIKSTGKSANVNERTGEDDIYESVDSHRVVNRILEEIDTTPHLEFSEPESIRLANRQIEDRKPHPLRRIEHLPGLKRAVVWSEILSKPKGLQRD